MDTIDETTFAKEDIGTPLYCSTLLYALANGTPLPPKDHGIKRIAAEAATKPGTPPQLPKRLLPEYLTDAEGDVPQLYVMSYPEHMLLLERVEEAQLTEGCTAVKMWKANGGPRHNPPPGCAKRGATAHHFQGESASSASTVPLSAASCGGGGSSEVARAGGSLRQKPITELGGVKYTNQSFTLTDPTFNHFGLVVYRITSKPLKRKRNKVGVDEAQEVFNMLSQPDSSKDTWVHSVASLKDQLKDVVKKEGQDAGQELWDRLKETMKEDLNFRSQCGASGSSGDGGSEKQDTGELSLAGDGASGDIYLERLLKYLDGLKDSIEAADLTDPEQRQPMLAKMDNVFRKVINPPDLPDLARSRLI